MLLSQDAATAQNILQYANGNPSALANMISEIYTSLGEVQPQVGGLVWTMRTLVQHSAVCPGTWLLCDGQACVGTTYETLSGNAFVPDTSLLITIGNVFIRVD
jgi:hypothetical protein